MSERKPRYFQHEFGGVYYATLPDAVADYENDRTMTEVQVVPIDAIVIRREDVPMVRAGRPGSNGVYVKDEASRSLDDDPTDVRRLGIALLAIAEYLREHPPVDEGLVREIADLIDEDEHWGEDGDTTTIARRLVERGVRVVKP
jgi:hypothetical protein